jgi:hypothetical protein
MNNTLTHQGAEKLHGLILNRQKRSTPVSPTKPADYPIVQPEAQTAPLAPNANGLNSQI